MIAYGFVISYQRVKIVKEFIVRGVGAAYFKAVLIQKFPNFFCAASKETAEFNVAVADFTDQARA